MKMLAIDTSSKRCSVCILENNNVLINLYNDDEKTHSVKLMPMIDKAFYRTGLTLNDISALSCCVGPGSFTGVRIGIATIKAFADVKNIPVIGVSSLETLAYNIKDLALESNTLICSLIDAKNNNVYCGLYSFTSSKCNTIAIFAENINITIEKIKEIMHINNFSNIVFVGDATEIHSSLLSSEFNNIKFASDNQNYQSGVSLANAGLSKFLEGNYGDSSSLTPIYLKKSQAERSFEEKIKITRMTLNDIDNITPDFNKEFDKFWNINNLKNDFANPNSTYFVAKFDTEIVGFAGILKICDEANIMNIVTKVNKRRLGIGSKLLQSLIASAKEQNCKSIILEVNENNKPAINLYKKYNFNRIGLRKKYYNNTDNAILMSLSQ